MLSTPILPLWASMTWRAIIKPKPVLFSPAVLLTLVLPKGLKSLSNQSREAEVLLVDRANTQHRGQYQASHKCAHNAYDDVDQEALPVPISELATQPTIAPTMSHIIKFIIVSPYVTV